MAKCKGCGVELLDGTVFCPYCGAQVEKEETVEKETVVQEVNNGQYEYAGVDIPKKDNGAFKVFAILGMVFGIVVLSCCGITILSLDSPQVGLFLSAVALEFSVPGLVFSIIGKKSFLYHKKAVFGFVVNLVCLIVSFILLFVCAFIFVAQGGTPDDIYGGYYF